MKIMENDFIFFEKFDGKNLFKFMMAVRIFVIVIFYASIHVLTYSNDIVTKLIHVIICEQSF